VGNLVRWGWLAFEDEEASAAAARAAEAWLATQSGGSPATAVSQYVATCSLAQWQLSQRDPVSAERAMDRMRLVAPGAIAAGMAGMNTQREPLCLTMTEAWLAVERGQPDARQLVAQLDSLSDNSGVEMGRIELVFTHARLLESVDDLAAAMRMIRRVPYHHDAAAVLPLAVIAREEGRIAALAGDREGAIRAYRRYLALRVEPDESLKPEVDQVRTELARLERGGAGR
jgi:hypothetical protein